jgi:hypothetical protein
MVTQGNKRQTVKQKAKTVGLLGTRRRRFILVCCAIRFPASSMYMCSRAHLCNHMNELNRTTFVCQMCFYSSFKSGQSRLVYHLQLILQNKKTNKVVSRASDHLLHPDDTRIDKKMWMKFGLSHTCLDSTIIATPFENRVI